LHFLLVASSETSPTLDSALGVAAAAARRGHEVTVFFYMGGVHLLKASRALSRLTDPSMRGVRLLACRTSAKERGIDSEAGLPERTEMSSLSELVELLDRCDRALFLG